jgi:hypothetical protein
VHSTAWGSGDPLSATAPPVSSLVIEILLRFAKAAVAALLGAILYILLTGPLGAPGSVELALLSWLSAAVFLLLVESSPL